MQCTSCKSRSRRGVAARRDSLSCTLWTIRYTRPTPTRIAALFYSSITLQYSLSCTIVSAPIRSLHSPSSTSCSLFLSLILSSTGTPQRASRLVDTAASGHTPVVPPARLPVRVTWKWLRRKVDKQRRHTYLASLLIVIVVAEGTGVEQRCKGKLPNRDKRDTQYCYCLVFLL